MLIAPAWIEASGGGGFKRRREGGDQRKHGEADQGERPEDEVREGSEGHGDSPIRELCYIELSENVKTPPVPGLAEPGLRETPGWEFRGKAGLGEAGLQGGGVYPASARPATRGACTRPRRGRSLRDARPEIVERPASARPATRGRRVPGLGEAGLCETPGWESWKGRPRRGRLQGGGVYPGSPSPVSPKTPGGQSRKGRPRRGRLQGGGVYPASARLAAGPQCRKWRMPVNTIATPAASAAAITSASRSEPPGWMTAVAPASIAATRPSANGKNASEATTEPVVAGAPARRRPSPSARRRARNRRATSAPRRRRPSRRP